MKNIENIENKNCWGDFIWVHFRGFLFLALCLLSISAMLNISIHFSNEIEKSKINEIRFCPYCSHDLLN